MNKMSIPIDKNKRWVESLLNSIDQLSEDLKAAIMKQAGKGCVSDIVMLCEDHLGRKIDTIQDLVNGWNILRESRNLKGGWKMESGKVHGVFNECGCPLVRSGLIELHPVQCLCSKEMIETVFTKVAEKEVQVVIERSIAKGDDTCEFVVRL